MSRTNLLATRKYQHPYNYPSNRNSSNRTSFAVIEMAAYGRGSIQRLCNLTSHAGIVTAVGLAHLDRFGSQENIYLNELAQAIPKDGILVCNGDNEGARRIASEHQKAVTLLYGLDTDKGQLTVGCRR